MPLYPTFTLTNYQTRTQYATILTHPLPNEDIMYDCPTTENNPEPNHHGGHDCRRLVEMEESEENDSCKY